MLRRVEKSALFFMNSQLPLLSAPKYWRDEQKLVIVNTEGPGASVEDIKQFLGTATIENTVF
jgi:hypothetical protein